MEAWGSEGLTEEVERREELRELVADLGKLPEPQRAALVLSELEALSHAQIAQVLRGGHRQGPIAGVPGARLADLHARGARHALRRNQVPALDAHGLVAAAPHVAPPRPRHVPGCREFEVAVRGQRPQLRPDPSGHRRSRPARRCAAVRVGGAAAGSGAAAAGGLAAGGAALAGGARRRRRGWCARRTRGSRGGQRSCADHRGGRDRRHGHGRAWPRDSVAQRLGIVEGGPRVVQHAEQPSRHAPSSLAPTPGDPERRDAGGRDTGSGDDPPVLPTAPRTARAVGATRMHRARRRRMAATKRCHRGLRRRTTVGLLRASQGRATSGRPPGQAGRGEGGTPPGQARKARERHPAGSGEESRCRRPAVRRTRDRPGADRSAAGGDRGPAQGDSSGTGQKQHPRPASPRAARRSSRAVSPSSRPSRLPLARQGPKPK